MLDLKVINTVLGQLEEERGVPRAKVFEAIELALATAYKKEYGKKGQFIRATFDMASGQVEFFQVKIVVDESRIIMPDPETGEVPEVAEDDERVVFNSEHHILLADAQKIKRDATIDEEIVFPLEHKDDFGRIASQTAKQVIIQKIREAEKESVVEEYGGRQGDIISGTVQRVERGNIFIDLGRATGFLPYDEQIPGEKYRQGERIRGYLFHVEESPRGVFLRLSRSHPQFLAKLFAVETPEIASGTVEIKAIAREAGSRSKIAVQSHDDHIDPVGSLVGQRGVRVSTVMSELGGEKIDIIEWSEDTKQFIEDALSPAKVVGVEILSEENREAQVTVAEDQQSLAIGKGGQNVRLAAKLTGWKIDIQSIEGSSDETDSVEPTKVVKKEEEKEEVAKEEVVKEVEALESEVEAPASVEEIPAEATPEETAPEKDEKTAE
jgi:N utilization substance protein A